jgi:hypothetical protein
LRFFFFITCLSNFSGELLKLLTALLRHEVDTIGKPSSSPSPRRRHSASNRGKYDQFLSSEDEGYATLDEKTGDGHNNNE